MGVIRTERRGGNVTPKVVIDFGRYEDAAQGSRSTNKKEELWKFQASLAYGGVTLPFSIKAYYARFWLLRYLFDSGNGNK